MQHRNITRSSVNWKCINIFGKSDDMSARFARLGVSAHWGEKSHSLCPVCRVILSHLLFVSVSSEGRSREEHHTGRRWTLPLWQRLEQEEVTGWSLLFFQRIPQHRRRCARKAWLIFWEKGVKKSESGTFSHVCTFPCTHFCRAAFRLRIGADLIPQSHFYLFQAVSW